MLNKWVEFKYLGTKYRGVVINILEEFITINAKLKDSKGEWKECKEKIAIYARSRFNKHIETGEFKIISEN